MVQYLPVTSNLKNKLNYVLKICTTIISIVLLTECSNYSYDKFTEGIIEYDICYVNNSEQSFPLQLLPKTMEFKFNKNFASFSIEDKIGAFALNNVKNLKEHNQVTMIKFFTEKYFCVAKKKETSIFFKSSTPYKVILLKDTFRMAGVACKKANVTDISSMQSYDVAYTSSIGMRDPNANTPYKKINGLLMNFKLKIKDLEMTLTAKKIIQKKVSDEDFLVPEGYKYISTRQMESILANLLP